MYQIVLPRFVRTAFVVGLTAPVLALSSSAHAASDFKTYNAAGHCFTRDPTVTSISRSSAGIANTGTVAVSILCPVTKDVSAGGPPGFAGSVSGGFVTYVDNTTTGHVTCDLVSAQRNGSKVANSPVNSVDGDASAAAKVLEFTALQTVADGNLVLGCTIPPKSGSGALSKIISYQVRETE